MDVIVIGGGIAGCATAFFLAELGAAVLLLEAEEVNARASGSNAGSLHAQIPAEPFVTLGEGWARRFASSIGIYRASLDLWRGLEERLGVDLEIQFGGGLLVAQDEAEMRLVERKVAIELEQGLGVELLGQADLRRIAPYVSDTMIGGSFCPAEGKANPLLVAPAFAAAAKSLGAAVRTHEVVKGIVSERRGFAVHTSTNIYRAPRVVSAAGIGTNHLLALLGRSLPIQTFPIQVSVSEPAEPLIPHLVYAVGQRLTMKQARVGTILIGGGWPARLDDQNRPMIDPDSLAANLAVALDVVPAIGSLNIVRSWAAMVNGTEDWLPVLGEMPGIPGFFVHYFPWMGFTAGPAASLVLAHLVLDRPSPFAADWTQYAPG
jgi:sarcosine oxidase, subunit beta